MKEIKKINRRNLTSFFLIFIWFLSFQLKAQQDEAWFYFRAHDTVFNPSFEKEGAYLKYTGSDKKLKDVLDRYQVKMFKKTWRNAKKENLRKTFFVIADKEDLMQELLNETAHLFSFGEIISDEDKKIFEPNDYGLTSTIGENIGAQVNLDYYDFLDVPKAWYYTTGSRDVIIGISDGQIDTLDIEFKGKSKIIQKSFHADGHGFSVAETAAGQGDNGYGIPGVCYNCSIYNTNYGRGETLEQLLELSEMGVQVINCSWGTTRYYETAQQAIYEMLENGTVVVAIGHNKPYSEGKGKVYYYPASYDKVISVSSASHRYADYTENIQISMPKELYYVENIRYYVGRTAGFKDNDTTNNPDLYPISIKNLNDKIDIVAPSVGLFRYSEFALNNKIDMSEFNQTSGVAPLVSGTVGLMFSLYPCLPADEVESILKLTSTNIDDIPANKPYRGLYGAGMMNTGKAVKMVFDMFAEESPVQIENQRFSRWNFKLTSISEVEMRNQEFTDDATLNLTSKNGIIIAENTVLRPGNIGNIHLKIDPDMEKECDLRLRDPAVMDK